MRTRPMLRPVLLAAALLALAEPSSAQQVRTPERGSAERTAILDGLRQAVAREIGVTLRLAEWREGLMDDGIYALLRLRNGRWTAVEVVIGPTDVSWEAWDDQFGAPSWLFPNYRQP